MIKHLIVVLISAFSVTIYSQSDRIDTDSIYKYGFAIGSWWLSSIERTETSNDNTFTYDVYRFDDFDEEYLYRRTTMTFDDSGNLIVNRTQEYDNAINGFVDVRLQLQEYDAMNRRVKSSWENWDSELQLWEKGIKYEYSNFNEYNDYNLFDIFMSDNANEWNAFGQVDYERFYSNELLDSVSATIFYSDGSFNSFYDVSKYSYDSEDRVILRRKYRKDDDNLENLNGVPGLDYHHIYEDNLYTNYKIDEYDDVGMPNPTDSIVFTRSEENLLLEKIDYVYFLGDPLELNMEVYYYPEESVHTHDLQTLDVSFNWYSEYQRSLDISLNELEIRKTYRVYISDMSGKLLKFKTVKNLKEWNANYILDSGVYTLVVQSEDQVYSQQVFVK